jgi:hypothetical protein
VPESGFVDRFLNVLGETFGFDFEAIVAGDELAYFINAVFAGDGGSFGVGPYVH